MSEATDMMLPKRKPWRSKAYTQAAEGQPCTLRSPACNGDPATTVFCHLNESWAGKGMGQKADDFAGFDGCSDCHAYYDARGAVSDYMLLRAMYETIRNRLDRGILKRGKNG